MALRIPGFVIVLALAQAFWWSAATMAQPLPGLSTNLESHAAAARAESDFERIYGARLRQVRATRDEADDVAFAQELIQAGAAVSGSQALQAVIYQRALELAVVCANGEKTAREAQEGLLQRAQVGPAHVMGIYDAIFRDVPAGSSVRRRIADPYLQSLLMVAEGMMQSGQFEEAARLYRRGMPLADMAASSDRQTVGELMRLATEQVAVERRINQLRRQVEKDRNPTAARDLASLLVCERQDIAGAVAAAAHANDPALRERLKLMTAPVNTVEPAACLDIGHWLWQQIGATSGANRSTLQATAGAYYQRYMDNVTTRDADWLLVESRLAETRRLDGRAAALAQGAVEFNGHLYKFFEGPVTWVDAKARCEAMGGYLATIHSAEENAFVFKLGHGRECWIGLNREGDKWVWVTGEPVTFTAWHPGQPDGRGGHEPFVHYWSEATWNDRHHEPMDGFICEWD